MQSLRHHRWWMTLTLVLALVFTMGGLPARALVCGGAGESLLAAAPEGASCHTPEASKPCCCSHEAAKADHAGSPAEWSGADCGCTIEAPASVPPADRSTSRILPMGDVFFPPLPAAAVPLPSSEAPVVVDRVLLPPGATLHSATPPRAPPSRS